MKRQNTEMKLVRLLMDAFNQIMDSIPFLEKVEYHILNSRESVWDVCAVVSFNDGRKPLYFYFNIQPNGEKRFVNRYLEKYKDLPKEQDADCYVFVAPYISEATGKMLLEKYHSYMDLSGNCYLLASNIIIRNSGQPNRYIQKRERYGYFQKGSSAASAVLRTIMDAPYVHWQVKQLSELTGKAIGTVSNIKNFLKSQDWIQEYSHGFQIRNIEEILYTWAKEYHQSESQLIEYYSLDTVPQIEAKIAVCNTEHKTKALLGGFSAAARYAPTVRYKKVQVYVQPQELELLTQELGLKKVSSGGNVVITIPHDETVCMFAKMVNGDMVTSPVQTILDLLGSPGRGEEAANAIILKEYREDK